MPVSLDKSVKLNCAFQSGNPPFLRTRRLKSKISVGKQAVFPDNLDFRLILLRQVTPARYTSLAGCDSTLRRARPNGSSRVGRHQPEMSESPTIYVHIPGKWFTLPWILIHEKTRCSKNICHCSSVPPRQRYRMWPRRGQILFYSHLATEWSNPDV